MERHDWKTQCPQCNGTNGKLDMAKDPGGCIGLYYVFRCRDCRTGWITGMVMGPTPELRDKYLELAELK